MRHALRGLARTPAFTTVVVVTMALGIGAVTALFTLTDALLWRPLPVQEPERLVHVARLDVLDRPMALASPLLQLLREEQLFDGVCGFQTSYITVTLNGVIAPRATHAMTGDCFETLGVRALLGRTLTPADDPPGAPKVAMLTYRTWQREYDGRSGVLGEIIDISGEPFTIVGVTDQGFTGLLVGFPPKVIFPISQRPRVAGDARPAGAFSAHAFARLRDGQSVDEVRARLQARWRDLLAATAPRAAGVQRESYLSSRLLVAPAATGIDYGFRDRFGSNPRPMRRSVDALNRTAPPRHRWSQMVRGRVSACVHTRKGRPTDLRCMDEPIVKTVQTGEPIPRLRSVLAFSACPSGSAAPRFARASGSESSLRAVALAEAGPRSQIPFRSLVDGDAGTDRSDRRCVPRPRT